jgi:hypothetical protein
MSQVLAAIPRCERSLAGIEAEVAALAAEFDAVAQQASQIDMTVSQHATDADEKDAAPSQDAGMSRGRAETVASPTFARSGTYIDDLETLDRAKRNMEDAKTLLHEAAAWDRLVREVDIVFEGADLARVADHISMLQRSAAALSDLPEDVRRADTLRDVRAKFEALVLPQLESALAADDHDALVKLIEVFTRMGQVKFVCSSFAKARIAPLMDAWTESYDPQSSFVEWLGVWPRSHARSPSKHQFVFLFMPTQALFMVTFCVCCHGKRAV